MAAIAVCGSIAQRPGRPGHAWAFLNYLLGFQGLGYEVLFVDRLGTEMVEGAEAGGSLRSSREALWLAAVMRDAGLEDSYCLLLGDDDETAGMPRRELLDRLRGAVLLLNVNGFLADRELLEAAQKRVYLDIDPGFAQMWEEMGLAALPDGHDAFVTVGLNVGKELCAVPTVGRDWVTTVPPVVLDSWPATGGGDAFTSIGSWRGPFDPVAYEGCSYGLRAHELRRFAELPRLLDAPFELALEIAPEDHRDAALLRDNSWRLADPLEVAGDSISYRRYIQGSLAEIAIPKSMYVETKSGWFSDRSACYLASGKPVLALDTGFASSLPTGEGLLRFGDLDEAVRGGEEICADPGRHSEAARAIAEEHFEAGRVLTALLERLEVG
jgi:hypothetical protein